MKNVTECVSVARHEGEVRRAPAERLLAERVVEQDVAALVRREAFQSGAVVGVVGARVCGEGEGRRCDVRNDARGRARVRFRRVLAQVVSHVGRDVGADRRSRVDGSGVGNDVRLEGDDRSRARVRIEVCGEVVTERRRDAWRRDEEPLFRPRHHVCLLVRANVALPLDVARPRLALRRDERREVNAFVRLRRVRVGHGIRNYRRVRGGRARRIVLVYVAEDGTERLLQIARRIGEIGVLAAARDGDLLQLTARARSPRWPA